MDDICNNFSACIFRGYPAKRALSCVSMASRALWQDTLDLQTHFIIELCCCCIHNHFLYDIQWEFSRVWNGGTSLENATFTCNTLLPGNRRQLTDVSGHICKLNHLKPESAGRLSQILSDMFNVIFLKKFKRTPRKPQDERMCNDVQYY